MQQLNLDYAKSAVQNIVNIQSAIVRDATTPEAKAEAVVEALKWAVMDLHRLLEQIYEQHEYELRKQHAIDMGEPDVDAQPAQ